MERATVSQLKNQLSAYLRKVRAGQAVLILDRNQPIARLERVDELAAPEERLARLHGKGALRPGSGKVPLSLLRAPAAKPKQSVVEALVEERRGGR